MKIKDLIKNQTVKFECYKQGNLWYSVNGFIFPVPVEDTGEGEFKREDKAIFYMRYIRKHMLLLKDKEAS